MQEAGNPQIIQPSDDQSSLPTGAPSEPGMVTPDPQPGWAYRDTGAAQAVAMPVSVPDADQYVVEWQSGEAHGRDKSPIWHVLYALASVAAIAGIYFLTQDVVAIITIVVVLGVFFVAFVRKQQSVSYRLDAYGVWVDRRHYVLSDFRMFYTVSNDPGTLVLVPMKRFSTLVSLRCTPEVFDQVGEVLANQMPFEERESDPIESIMHRLRF